MATVEFSHVVKRFGDVLALRDLTLHVQDGEFMVFVGPSGCGKSTLLRLVAGLEQLTAGQITIGGRLMNGVPPNRRRVAMVFQNYALYPHYSVYENLAFGLKLQRLPRAAIAKRVGEAADLLELTNLLARRPAALSGGQQQRVALGRALVQKPQVFLLDEPLAHLDAQLRLQMRSVLGTLHRRRPTTTIYVTHDQVEAMAMGNRIVVINDGAIQQIAPPQELYERPANVFVAGFIGSPAMNLIPGQVRTERGGTVFSGGGLMIPLPAGAAKARGAAPKSVFLGVRPEAVGFEPAGVEVSGGTAGRYGSGPIATVEAVEPLGPETLLHLRHGEIRLVARAKPHTRAAAGDRVQVTFDAKRVRWFCAQTQLAIEP